MKKSYLNTIVILIAAISACSSMAFGQANSSYPWWLSSSLTNPDTTDAVRYHAEGDFSFTNMSGNLEGTVYRGKILNFIRKGRVTGHLNYLADISDITKFADNSGDPHSASKIVTNKQIAEAAIDYDLTKVLFLEGGTVWERDINSAILNRYSYYGGLGINQVFEGKHFLNAVLAAGVADIEYDIPPPYTIDMFDVQKKPAAYLFFMQSYAWNVTEKISFQEGLRYYPNLSETKRYRYAAELRTNFAVWDFLSFFIGYDYAYDNDAKNVQAYSTDTKTMIGIKLQY
ncbi:MAG: DUF481 domain-containing protein [Chloroflexota bacterium]